MTKLDKSLRYESTSRFIIEMSMSLAVSVFVNIFYGDISSTINTIAFVCSLLLMFGLFALLIYTFIYPLRYFRKIQTHPDLNERHCFLFLEFK